ncbi:MAG: sulfatase/phosphatase domain-containing protein, partial [Opitutaceae bacterium]
CRAALQAYYASVSFVDAQVGRVLAALDRLGLTQNTLVVLWSDHGYHLGEHGGVWQKRGLFEESARAPLLIRDPAATGNGAACARVVEFVDIYPTVADLCGLKPPVAIAGRSLRPLLVDPAMKWNGQAITQILRPADSRLPQAVMGRSIRTDRWRYTEWDEGRSGIELYDHASDPREHTNLATNPQHAEQCRDLRARLVSHAQGTTPPTPFNPARL